MSASVYLYSPYLKNFGGGERYLLYLAASLSKLPEAGVTLLSEFPEITKTALEDFFKLDLSRVRYKTIEGGSRSLRAVIDGADIFIPLSNFRVVRAAPRHYVQALQVPYAPITPFTVSMRMMKGEVREGVKDILRKQLLSHAEKISSFTLTNSRFVHDSLLRNFNLESSVLYPPIEDFFARGIPKRRIILSVGRIFRGLYNNKRYDVLTDAFRKLSGVMPEWEYHIVGSVASDDKSQTYLSGLKEASRGHRIFFHVNERYESLKVLYNEATIYWHGAGFGVNETKHPEATEHFGMSVAEALSASCVPIVVNKGGLKEIVTEGENGYLWETTDQLMDFTLNVARMSFDQLTALQSRARESYRRYGLQKFDERVAELFTPVLTPP